MVYRLQISGISLLYKSIPALSLTEQLARVQDSIRIKD